MAKAKFDRSDVVAAATELFWRKGYNCASMQDVFRATGLQPGSLYNAFGNKEGLYEESVRYYGTQAVKKTEDSLAGVGNKLEAIATMVLAEAKASLEPEFKSCMLVKSLLELNSMGNERLAQVVNDQVSAITAVYESVLAEAFDAQAAREKATQLMMARMGLYVYGLMQTSQDELIANLRGNLPWLPWDSVDSDSATLATSSAASY